MFVIIKFIAPLSASICLTTNSEINCGTAIVVVNITLQKDLNLVLFLLITIANATPNTKFNTVARIAQRSVQATIGQNVRPIELPVLNTLVKLSNPTQLKIVNAPPSLL